MAKKQVSGRKAVKKADRRGTPKGKGTRAGSGGGGKIGNPPFVATAEQRIKVEAMVTAGAQHWFIAEQIGISEDTLERHFRPELDHGQHRALSKLGSSLIQQALNGDNDLGKFIMARIGGWKAATSAEHTGPNGGPIEYRNLSDEEIETRISELMNHAARATKA